MSKEKVYFTKTIFLATFLLFFSVQISAQVRQVTDAIKPKNEFIGEPILTKKSQVLQIGIAAPNNVISLLNLGGFGSLFSSNSEKKTGPLFIAYEYFIKENIGLGATVAYAKGEKTYTNPFSSNSNEKYTANLSGVSLLLSTTYHFYSTDKLDPYAKGSVGITLWNGSFKDQNGAEPTKLILPTPVGYSALVGLRYFATPKIAPFGELSYSNLKFTAGFGLAIKLK